MAKNYIPEIAHMLGVEIGEEFAIHTDTGGPEMIVEVPTPEDPECPVFALLDDVNSCEDCLARARRVLDMEFPENCLRRAGDA